LYYIFCGIQQIVYDIVVDRFKEHLRQQMKIGLMAYTHMIETVLI